MLRGIALVDAYDRSIGGIWWLLLIQGLVLIGLGVLVLVEPSLLVGLAAAVFIGAGLMAVLFAVRLRRAGRRIAVVRREWWAAA